jgi:hypothetical protein
MLRKLLFLASFGACLLLSPVVALATDVATTVTITGTVETFAEWDSATQTILAVDFDDNITGVGQTRTAAGTFVLYMNGDVSIAPTAGANAGVLTNGTETLTTKYKLTGDLDTPEVAFTIAAAGAGEFFDADNDHAITHVGGTGAYDVILNVQMISAAAEAPDAGDYTCGVVLTATF